MSDSFKEFYGQPYAAKIAADEANQERKWLEEVSSERLDILATVCAVDELRRKRPCRELSIAITKLEEVAMWLNQRIELGVPRGKA